MSQDVSSRFGAWNVKTSVHRWLQVHFRRIPKKSTASTGGMSLTWAAVPTELLVSYWWTLDDVDVWHLCFLDCNMLIYVDICWMFILLRGHCRYLLKFCWNALDMALQSFLPPRSREWRDVGYIRCLPRRPTSSWQHRHGANRVPSGGTWKGWCAAQVPTWRAPSAP